MPKQTNYKVGIYLRLSRDDERQGESLSIETRGEFSQTMSRNRAGRSTMSTLMTGLAALRLRDRGSRGCLKMQRRVILT